MKSRWKNKSNIYKSKSTTVGSTLPLDIFTGHLEIQHKRQKPPDTQIHVSLPRSYALGFPPLPYRVTWTRLIRGRSIYQNICLLSGRAGVTWAGTEQERWGTGTAAWGGKGDKVYGFFVLVKIFPSSQLLPVD